MNFTSDGTGAGNYHSGGGCSGGTCLWFSEGCYAGCNNCSLAMPTAGNYYGAPNCAAPREPTLPDAFRTWNIGNPSRWGDWTKYHPWRSPGAAPVADPCGVAGGYAKPRGGGGQTPQGARQLDPGSQLPPSPNRTLWRASAPVEVGFMLGANHGGGYLYSVCPTSEGLTEACFRGEGRQLAFVGSNSTIRYRDGSHAPRSIAARDVRVGTTPAGSAWRRNPIPACNCDKGFDCSVNSTASNYSQTSYRNDAQPTPHTSCADGYSCAKGLSCPTGTQFDVPFDFGYGQQIWDLTPASTAKAGNPLAAMTWEIVDTVRAPAEAGDFVLRWRWDVEQNPQIWTHCADITVI